MKNFGRSKKKFAQQLVEFLLVAPFLLIILGILTEYAYALNCNTTLSDGLKMVTSSLYSQINPTMDNNATKNKILADLRSYLQANNVPTRQENTLTVSSTIIGQNAVFIANYKYVSAFTLPNVFFHFLPDSFNFQAISIIPKSFLKGNSAYTGGINSTSLDKIWTGTNFSGVTTYNGVKNGAMTACLRTGSIPRIIFLVKSNVANIYNIVAWNGGVLGTLNMTTGRTNSGTNLLSAYPNHHTFIFVNDIEVPSNLTNLPYYWTHIKDSCQGTPSSCQPIGNAQISSPTVDGILKRALGLIKSDTLLPTNGGNFDNLAVDKYNKEVAPIAAIYTTDTFGSDVFIHRPSENITTITNGRTPPNVNYIFGNPDKGNY